MDTGWAIISGAVLATLGWLVTNRSSFKNHRREHSFELCHTFRLRDTHVDNLAYITSLIKKSRVPHPYDDSRRADIKKIDYVLNHYEFICAAILKGDLDEEMFRACEYSTITTLPQKLSEYISQSQERQPTVFCHLLEVAQRWKSPEPPCAHRLYEYFMMRPCRKLPKWMRYLPF